MLISMFPLNIQVQEPLKEMGRLNESINHYMIESEPC
jgi:hypothetical protein